MSFSRIYGIQKVSDTTRCVHDAYATRPLIVSVFRWNFSYSCAKIDKISTDMVCCAIALLHDMTPVCAGHQSVDCLSASLCLSEHLIIKAPDGIVQGVWYFHIKYFDEISIESPGSCSPTAAPNIRGVWKMYNFRPCCISEKIKVRTHYYYEPLISSRTPHTSFSRIRQVAPMCTLSNTWFLGLT